MTVCRQFHVCSAFAFAVYQRRRGVRWRGCSDLSRVTKRDSEAGAREARQPRSFVYGFKPKSSFRFQHKDSSRKPVVSSAAFAIGSRALALAFTAAREAYYKRTIRGGFCKRCSPSPPTPYLCTRAHALQDGKINPGAHTAVACSKRADGKS